MLWVLAGCEPAGTDVKAMGEKLSHVDEHGRIRMVDVGGKEETERVARVRGEIRMLPATLRLVTENRVAKGNVLEAARLAGVMAAKRTACASLGKRWKPSSSFPLVPQTQRTFWPSCGRPLTPKCLRQDEQ